MYLRHMLEAFKLAKNISLSDDAVQYLFILEIFFHLFNSIESTIEQASR